MDRTILRLCRPGGASKSKQLASGKPLRPSLTFSILDYLFTCREWGFHFLHNRTITLFFDQLKRCELRSLIQSVNEYVPPLSSYVLLPAAQVRSPAHSPWQHNARST